MCCTRLAENTGRKKRHFGTIAQLCRRCSSGRQPNFCGVEQRAPPIFGRAVITLGIDPHSSCLFVPSPAGWFCLSYFLYCKMYVAVTKMNDDDWWWWWCVYFNYRIERICGWEKTCCLYTPLTFRLKCVLHLDLLCPYLSIVPRVTIRTN